MLGIFKNHEDTLVVENYFLQANDIDMIDLPTQLAINNGHKAVIPPFLAPQTGLSQNIA
jgi:hypothetical protein